MNEILYWVAFLPVYILVMVLGFRLGLACTLEYFSILKGKWYILLYILICPLVWFIPVFMMFIGVYCISSGMNLGDMIESSGFPDMFRLNLDFFSK